MIQRSLHSIGKKMGAVLGGMLMRAVEEKNGAPIEPLEPISVIEQEASYVEHLLGEALSDDVSVAYPVRRKLMGDNGRVVFVQRGERKYSTDFHQPDEITHAIHVQLALKSLLYTRPRDFEVRLEHLLDQWSIEDTSYAKEPGFLRIADYMGGKERR